MPIFKIHHKTRYDYDRVVKESVNDIRIYPFQCPEQETLEHDLFITGGPSVFTFTDYWGNKTGLFNLLPPHKELLIESRLVVRTLGSKQLAINFHSGFEELQQAMQGNLLLMELALPARIEKQEEIAHITRDIYQQGQSVATVVERSSEYVFKHYKYVKGITNTQTTVDEILGHRAGVCQDFTHLMLQMLRTLGIPARYISGYICPNKNGMRGEGATHAWVEAWIPGYGWAGIDPTNNVWVTNTHVKLAVGRNFTDCSPVKGSFKGPAQQKLTVYVTVSYEDGQSFGDKTDVGLEQQEEAMAELSDEQAQQQ